MKQHILFFSILGLLISSGSLACSCKVDGPFIKMASKTGLVALVKVSKYLSYNEIQGSNMPMSMEVEIVEIYKGKEDRKKVTVWGDIGYLCRPYLSVFKEGGYYVIAFINGTFKGGHPEEKQSDYAISICGTYWLDADVKKRTAIGNIDSSKTTIQFKELKSWLK